MGGIRSIYYNYSVGSICAGMKFDISNLQPFYENTGVGTHSSFLGGMASILASVPFFLAGFETIPQGIESAGGDTKGVGKFQTRLRH